MNPALVVISLALAGPAPAPAPPARPEAYYHFSLGQQARLAGDVDEAVAEYRKAVRLDPRSGSLRAFKRQVDDLRPTFKVNKDRKRPKALFIDGDAAAGWDANGVAVDGPPGVRGKRMPPAVAEDVLYAHVMQYWYPNLKTESPSTAP